MKTTIFSAQNYERPFLNLAAEKYGHEFQYQPLRLCRETAALAKGSDAVSAFVQDTVNQETLEILAASGIRFVALRCAGYNHVDLAAAKSLGIKVVRVPAYSPFAVAELTVALILALSRKLIRTHNRVREGNFSLEGLLGESLHDKTIGIIGTGKIGSVTARILHGFGCKLLGHDPVLSQECQQFGMTYMGLPELLASADIVSLHCPLTPTSRHLVGVPEVAMMKFGAMLINTSRGAIVDTRAVIGGLKSGRIGSLGIDVYEEEETLFFSDLSGQILQDDIFARLMTFPNVLITGHQGFFTREALGNIAEITCHNLSELQKIGQCQNTVS